MGLPPSVTKFTKNGITYIDNVDRSKYLISELIRAANRDVGKFIAKEARRIMLKKSGRGRRAIQTWNRKDGSLQIGYKGGAGFYAAMFEFGTKNTPKLGSITDAVESNIATIREIQGKYLSAIEDENNVASMIDENEEVSDDD